MNRFIRVARSFALFTLAVAPLAAGSWIVPAAAHVKGAQGTNWRTDLRLYNTGAVPLTANIFFLPANADNSGVTTKRSINVNGGGAVTIPDIVFESFGRDETGALLIDTSGGNLIVTSRTYNQVGRTTYGQFLPGVSLTQTLPISQVGHFPFVSKSSQYRTNIGFASTGGTLGKVTITLYDSANVKLGSGTFDVLPRGQAQVNDVFNAVNAPATDVARAEITATVPIIAYASVIDNMTGDPIAMTAQRESNGYNNAVLAAVGHSTGAVLSVWRSDLRIFNTAASSTTVTLTLYEQNAANGSPASRTLAIGARRVLALDDIVKAEFGLNSVNGSLRISSPAKLLIGSRTYNKSTVEGSYGQDVPAVPSAEFANSSQTLIFTGLLGGSQFRTNVGLFNPSDSAMDVTLELRTLNGTLLGSRTQNLQPGFTTQINDVFSWLGVNLIDEAIITMKSSGTGNYVAYASVIDSLSGDPVYIPAAH